MKWTATHVRHTLRFNIYIAHEENEEAALLFIDVNLGEGKKPRIVLYEGDLPETVAMEFSRKHCNLTLYCNMHIGLDDQMRQKLVGMLKTELARVLTKI